MIVDIAKCLHLLGATLFFGLLIMSFCLTAPGLHFKNNNNLSTHLSLSLSTDKFIIGLVFFVALTGTFLVYPKHYTFHTPWIDAAYLLLAIVTLLFFINYKLKQTFQKTYPKINKNLLLLYDINHIIIFISIVLIIHDAVTKVTLL